MSWRCAGAVLTAILLGSSASAQTYYGGYNLGPDYGAMLSGMMQQDQQLTLRMQQGQTALIQRVMQDPNCQASYRAYIGNGGRASFAEYAYQYAATAGFTPDGIARFQQTEAGNRAREMQSLNGLRAAEQLRGQAQAGLANGFSRNQAEFGNLLQGNSSWVDPNSGSTVALPYTTPNVPYQDPNSGQIYVMDNLGNYYSRTPTGSWYQMTPWR